MRAATQALLRERNIYKAMGEELKTMATPDKARTLLQQARKYQRRADNFYLPTAEEVYNTKIMHDHPEEFFTWAAYNTNAPNMRKRHMRELFQKTISV